MKIQEDITFIKKCKLENIIPTSAKVKLSIKSGNTKLHKRIAKIVLETELQNKHQQKKKIFHLLAFNLRTYWVYTYIMLCSIT